MNQAFSTIFYSALCACFGLARIPSGSSFSAYSLHIVCTGVTLQKVPDRVLDRTGTNLTYTLLATTVTEQ